jgi:putative transposase
MSEEKINLPKDFFKQFKTKKEFQSFFQSMFKEGVQQMLQSELDEHLGYEKNDSTGNNSSNSRNGSSKKTIKSETLGDVVLLLIGTCSPRPREYKDL